MLRLVVFAAAVAAALAPATGRASVDLVSKGRAAAVIVVPTAALPVITLAAKELQSHVLASTGVEVPIASEDALASSPRGRIFLGATRAATRAGFDPGKLPRDAYRIRTIGDCAYVVGGDSDGDPLHKSLSTAVGTLFAVYEVLDDDMGVRWLWPGDSGQFVPKRNSFSIRDRNEIVRPRFRFCGLRTNRPLEILWLRRMRMHGADGMKFGHAFGDWGARYGSEHPEWFEMDAQGTRHPGGSMCVSSPGLWKQIIDNWWVDQQSHPSLRTTVNVCENDRNGTCSCPKCLAWDGPEAAQPRPSYYAGSHNVSRRYAHFASEVLKLARERDPSAEVTCYAYLNYVFDPAGLKLDPGVIAGYVADVFYPRTPEDHEWVKRQWQGWAESGASLFLRPNYLLNGYCMPENWARQFADEFRFCERRGMMGSDFDSLNGQWSTMGPVLYVAGRLHAKPRTPVDGILKEYYSGFGPAARPVQAYWEYWEQYTREHTDVLQDGTAHWTTYPKDVYIRFPIESFAPADRLLAEAERAASSDPNAAAKVAFLRAGLDHARLCVETSITLSQAGSDGAKRQAAIEKLQAFRKTLTDPMAVNVDHNFFSCVDRERASGWPE